jgi:hypothetical protein
MFHLNCTFSSNTDLFPAHQVNLQSKGNSTHKFVQLHMDQKNYLPRMDTQDSRTIDYMSNPNIIDLWYIRKWILVGTNSFWTILRSASLQILLITKLNIH